MDADYLKTLGHLGVTARIKRLSDTLFYSIRELYRQLGVDMEPSWHLVFLILKQEGKVTMQELSNQLHLSKPAVTKMIKKMADLDYVLIGADKSDSRKKMVELSAKAHRMMPKFEKIWSAGQSGVRELLETNPHFMTALDDIEKQLEQMSFCDRAIQKLDK